MIGKELLDDMMAHIKACQEAMEMEMMTGSSASTHGLGWLTSTATKPQEPPPSITLDIFNQVVSKAREYSAPFRAPSINVTIPLTLTPEGQHWRDSLFTTPGIRIIEVPPAPIYKQARTHRKYRINKKWRKRYGTKLVGFDHFLGMQVLMDERQATAYCHPEAARLIRHELAKPRFRCQNCGMLVEVPRQGEAERWLMHDEPFPSMMPQDGPAAGIYDCPTCNAATEIMRTIGGGWHSVLLSWG